MLNNKKVVVVLPAYNAGKTLERTYREIPHEIVDSVLLVDDCSSDSTLSVAHRLGIKCFNHPKNKGYGGNQKTCYRKALEEGAEIVVMLHPDYQYTPKLLIALLALVAFGEYDIALGSRVLGPGALRGGMPFYKYLANRVLTSLQNIILNYRLSEYHTGFRAYTRRVLEELPILENSDNFIFDNEILVQARYFQFRIGEISCPARYDADSSSIGLMESLIYGVGILHNSMKYLFQKAGLKKYSMFDKNGRHLKERKYN